MELRPKHREALAELINIGYARAGKALSDLTGQRVVLNAPKVEIHSIDVVRAQLNDFIKGEVASVHQVFSGPVSGHALLLVGGDTADALTSALVPASSTAEDRRVARREALTEVGNILLQASMGACGDLLQVHVSFTVPRLHIESVDDMLNSVCVDNQELQFALLVRTRFELQNSQVSGYIVVILGVTSFSRLLDELEGWEKRQLHA
jgi:chemotaxis protein CheC